MWSAHFPFCTAHFIWLPYSTMAWWSSIQKQYMISTKNWFLRFVSNPFDWKTTFGDFWLAVGVSTPSLVSVYPRLRHGSATRNISITLHVRFLEDSTHVVILATNSGPLVVARAIMILACRTLTWYVDSEWLKFTKPVKEVASTDLASAQVSARDCKRRWVRARVAQFNKHFKASCVACLYRKIITRRRWQ